MNPHRSLTTAASLGVGTLPVESQVGWVLAE